MKILAIDDNEDILSLVKVVLESEGHDFVSVNDGRSGLKLMEENTYGAVLLDVAMPGFSGKDVINALVQNGIIKKQPIILFTASSISDSEIDGMIKQGVYSCLRKPMEIDTLLELLKNFS